MESWCQSFSVPLSILRLQNVYGPGQSVGNAYTGVLTFFARQLATGEVIDVYEDGQIIRDFVFVDDVVSALVAASQRPPSATRRLDIGSGSGVPLVEVAETMSSLANATAPQISGRYRQGDVRAASASISAAAEQLGWAPAVPLGDGLQALSRWVSTQVHG